MARRIRTLIAATAGTSLVILGLGSVGMQSASALPATRFVATTGSDTANTCLVSGAPCLTLGHAIGQAAAGDTIQLAPGTYPVSDNPTGTANLVPETLHDLTIQSNPSGGTAANTIIDAAGESRGLTVNADNVTVKNLTFRNAEIEGIAVEPLDPPGTATVSNLTLTGNAVTNNDRCSQHSAASGCPIQNSAVLPFGQGVALTNVVDSTVSGNTVTGNWGGIWLTAGTGNTISGNTVSNNGTQPVLGGTAPILGGNRFTASGITLSGGTGPLAAHGNTISGNTVNGNGYIGIFLLGGTLPVRRPLREHDHGQHRERQLGRGHRDQELRALAEHERQRDHRQPSEQRRPPRRRGNEPVFPARATPTPASRTRPASSCSRRPHRPSTARRSRGR